MDAIQTILGIIIAGIILFVVVPLLLYIYSSMVTRGIFKSYFEQVNKQKNVKEKEE